MVRELWVYRFLSIFIGVLSRVLLMKPVDRNRLLIIIDMNDDIDWF